MILTRYLRNKKRVEESPTMFSLVVYRGRAVSVHVYGP
jgi:hypothetical protein